MILKYIGIEKFKNEHVSFVEIHTIVSKIQNVSNYGHK